jgi:hypothetical protein
VQIREESSGAAPRAGVATYDGVFLRELVWYYTTNIVATR